MTSQPTTTKALGDAVEALALGHLGAAGWCWSGAIIGSRAGRERTVARSTW
jgi:hypothetical protein